MIPLLCNECGIVEQLLAFISGLCVRAMIILTVKQVESKILGRGGGPYVICFSDLLRLLKFVTYDMSNRHVKHL